MKTDNCPVCGSYNVQIFPAGEIIYWRCLYCKATFMGQIYLPNETAERKRYECHENHADDPGYRSFLNKVAAPLLERLPPGQKGLDFGCGPASPIPGMMEEYGHRVTLYDPFFFPDENALFVVYDFIVCTEVVEHFHRPAEEFKRLDGLLRDTGVLAIMTCFQTCDDMFENWHYRRDFTHVVFYRERTFHVIAEQMGWHCEIPVKDVVLMQKP